MSATRALQASSLWWTDGVSEYDETTRTETSSLLPRGTCDAALVGETDVSETGRRAMPNPSGVNRRKRPPKKKEPRFLRKRFPGYGRGAPVKVLRILGWTVGIWFASAILLGDSGVFSIITMHGMKGELEDELEELERVRAETEEYRDALESDPWTIERVAREEYGMIKDGETCYRVRLEGEE